MQTRYFYKLLLFLILAVPAGTGCKKLAEVNAPINSTSAANVYQDNSTAASVLTGIYSTVSQAVFTNGGVESVSLFSGLSADELTLMPGISNPIYIAYYRNALTDANTGTSDFWNAIYPLIFTANSSVAGLTASSSLTPGVKTQLLGEAKFARAFLYFYLVNLYGDVPLVLGTDYEANAKLARTPRAQVYQQIITDLKDAQGLLTNGYVESDAVTVYPAGTAERVRPNKWAALALLARVYLYTGDYVNAESASASVLANTSLYGLTPLNSTFLKNSMEAIWQLQPVLTGQNTQDARTFILPTSGPSELNPVYLSPYLVNSFEPNDQRMAGNWVDSIVIAGTTLYYPYKYKLSTTMDAAPSEYLMVLRLGEQYLIRAEARAQQGNFTGAAADLDSIRSRAGLSSYAGALLKDPLMTAILHERQVELFTEWGHRWLDLKRTGTVDAVMSGVSPTKGGSWNTDWQWYPIPGIELQRDHSLVQNPGY